MKSFRKIATKHMPASWPLVGFFVFTAMLFTGPAYADTIVLNTGETFVSSQVWEEGDKIRFDMHGLIVNVNKADVERVIGEQAWQSSSDDATDPYPTMVPPENALPETVDTQPEPAADALPDDNPVARPSPPQQPQPVASRSVNGTGLQGMNWNAPPESIAGLVKIKTDPVYGGIDQYHRPDESLNIGGARLDGIVYGFWRDRLYSIMFWVDGRPGYQRLAETVRSFYGDGTPSTTGLERYVWQDRDTDRMLEFDTQLNTGIFWMRSRELDRQIKLLYPE
jgi:hypothetical protein